MHGKATESVSIFKEHNVVMNKADLANKVHDMLGGTKVQSEAVVEAIVDEIVNALKSGDEVSIAGLGIFSTKMRPARMGRNPRTGESIQVPAMRVPKFRAAKALKEAVK
ncbi:MAG: HU family DNA-binding protein [Candidatus Paceibacteria bacterium]